MSRFVFNLEQSEINKVKEEFYQKFVGDIQGALVGNMSIEQFTDAYSKSVFYYAIADKEKYWSFFSLDKSLKNNPGWYRLNSDISSSPKRLKAGNYVHE